MKNFFFHTITLLLVLSILGPTIISFIDINAETVMYMDASEEENNKEENKEKLEQNEFVTDNLCETLYLVAPSDSSKNSFYISFNPDFSIEILLPPPEQRA